MQGTLDCFSQCLGCRWSVLDKRFDRREQIGSICFYKVGVISVLWVGSINKTI